MQLQRASLVAAVVSLLLGAAFVPMRPVTAQQRAAGAPRTSPTFSDGDWPRFTGDLAGTRFSKLKQINTANVATLKAAWTFPGVGAEETPIVVDGVMYVSTTGGAVALDADTGRELWRYGAAAAAGGG